MHAFPFLLLFCNGTLPWVVMNPLLINEKALLVVYCVFTLNISKLITLANKNEAVAILTLMQIGNNAPLVL